MHSISTYITSKFITKVLSRNLLGDSLVIKRASKKIESITINKFNHKKQPTYNFFSSSMMMNFWVPAAG